ncbi:MAG: DUF1800 family protein [Burkholderiales bacterium]
MALRTKHGLAAFAIVVAGIAWLAIALHRDKPPSLGTAIEYRDGAGVYRLAVETGRSKVPPDAVRTGGAFTVALEAGRGRLPVCEVDRDSCTPETAAFFVLATPANGCPPDSDPLYRAMDGKRTTTARLTVDPTVRANFAREGLTDGGLAGCAPRSDRDIDADIVRLLEQATLGPTDALVAEVRAQGIEAWIDGQLALNVTRYTQYPFALPPDDPADCVDDARPPVRPAKYCHTYTIAPWPVGWEFFRQARSAPDQLRLRLAHVWHQILVVSDGPGTYAYAAFHQMLRDNATGSFETLLTRYALSPFLGEYQNWLFNEPERDGLRPNENFAREIMQLFTIGVSELNEDGTPKLDASGQPVATYTQGDIETLARVFTGYGFPPLPGRTPEWRSTRYYIGDMVPFDAHHDRGAKRLLGGRIDLPADGTAQDDVRAAIHALVGHPNTPPFISRQLIQKLVTSDPSPGYVARVSAVFKDNGRGTRGDLAAVTRAILLDPEARGPRKIDPRYGRLREPVLFWTALIRGLDVQTDGVVPYEQASRSGQLLFLAPSVFNYYASDHTIDDGAIAAPEFGIYGSSEFLNRSNQLVELLYDADLPILRFHYGPRPYVTGATGTSTPSLTAYLDDAGEATRLADRVDRLFLHGTMPPGLRDEVVRAIDRIPADQRLARARMALRLSLASIDYQVQK